MPHDFTLFVPSKFYHQFPVDPIFRFRVDVKAIYRFYATLIHRFISPEKFIDENEAIINPDGFAKILDRLMQRRNQVCRRG